MTPIKASVIINNYNYGQYLNDAIQSVLDQDYPNVELILVDDGSTDNSIEVVSRWGDRLKAICKQNGGQGSAFNAGFAAASGEIIFFLDSDDLLHPNIVSKVVKTFESDNDIVKVQFRLQTCDENGSILNASIPSNIERMRSGDLKDSILQFPDDLTWQPTSGNAFSAEVLKKIFPMPEEEYRICADYYLSNIPGLFGSVVSIKELGGYYRIHQQNNHKDSALDLQKTREIIQRTFFTHSQILKAAKSLQLQTNNAYSDGFQSITYLAHRMVSIKLSPTKHPFSSDSTYRLCLKGIKSAVNHLDQSYAQRLMYICWFIAMYLTPPKFAPFVAEAFFYEDRRSLKHLFNAVF